MLKKILALSLALILTVGCLSACGAKGPTLAEVQESGKLIVATSPDFPPFENLEGGEVVGIEVELMEMICAELGVELVLEQINFDAVLTGVQTGKYDCGMSGISVTPKREKNTLFTTPYCLAAQALIQSKVEAWVVDDLTAAEMCKGDDSVKVLSESMTTEPYAFAFAFGSEDLVAEINKILEKLIADGTVEALFAKYDAPYTKPTN